MDLIGQAILDAVESLHFGIRPLQNDNTLNCIVTGRTGRWIMGVLWQDTGDVTVVALVPVFVPPDRIAQAQDFLAKLNAQMPHGEFFEIIDDSCGDIWFLLTGDICNDGVPSQDLAIKVMQRSCKTIDEHLPELMKAFFGGGAIACQEIGVHPPCAN